MKQLSCNIVKGLERRFYPVIRNTFLPYGTHLYQPIFVEAIKSEETKSICDTSYIRDNSMDWDAGIGKIFIQAGRNVDHYPANKSRLWSPPKSHSIDSFITKISELTINYGVYLFINAASTENLTADEKKSFKAHNIWMKRFNRLYIALIKRQANERGYR